MNNYLVLTAIGTYLLGWFSSLYGRIFQLLFLSIRIPRNKLAKIYYHLNSHHKFKFCFAESFPANKLAIVPDIENSLIIYDNIPLWLDISEKYLTAGWSSKEEICSITIFRWHKQKLFKLFELAELEKIKLRDKIDVYISREGYFRKLNQVRKNSGKVYLEKRVGKELLKLIGEFDSGKRIKTGVILHGPPGNGKTSIIKKLACKFDYNIYIPILRADMTNDQIINLFADIPQDEKAIIVLEDFDSIFCGRYPEGNQYKFTFDVFLNILDGLYCNLENKMTFLTANNIDRIDSAL